MIFEDDDLLGHAFSRESQLVGEWFLSFFLICPKTLKKPFSPYHFSV